MSYFSSKSLRNITPANLMCGRLQMAIDNNNFNEFEKFLLYDGGKYLNILYKNYEYSGKIMKASLHLSHHPMKLTEMLCQINDQNIFNITDNNLMAGVLETCIKTKNYTLFHYLYPKFTGTLDDIITPYMLPYYLCKCVVNREYKLFTILYPNLNENFELIFYIIIEVRDVSFMRLFSSLSKEYCTEFLNTRIDGKMLPLDKISKPYNELFYYMVMSGALSDHTDTKRIRIILFGLYLHKLMCDYRKGFYIESLKYNSEKLYKNDLIFHKILSYIV